MNIYKIEGNYSKRTWCVIAKNPMIAENVVKHSLSNEGYSDEDITEMELYALSDYCLPVTENTLFELA